ncbi:MAG: hypothetical protein M3Y42_16395 [Actinomycetota bacterium]|nr:hypothetical protein [Actinomycetota bacterium]
MRRATAALIAMLMAGALLGAWSPPVFAATVNNPATAPAGSEQAASAQAATTGTSVEVTDELSETTDVQANPDGTFTMTSTRVPVRVNRNGNWIPVDTSLTQNADGTLSPAATVEPLRFSGGGSGPLLIVGGTSQNVAFSWPSPLPSPSLAGDTATYANVLPGVDLQLTALADSYREILVVHDAVAAANPALAQLRLAASATGLQLRPSADGGLSATDGTGTEVLHGSAPIMWDSHINPEVGPAPAADDPGSGQVNRLGGQLPSLNGLAQTARSTFTLLPPAGALTGANVSYPLYIDPGMTGGKQHFAVVFNNGWHYYDDTTNDLKVGECPQSIDSSCNGIGTGRSYFTLDNHLITGRATTAHIYAATVEAYETHQSAGCTNEPVNLWSANGISASTVWGGPAVANLQTVNTNRNDNCSSAPPAFVSFNNANVVSRVQAAANGDVASMTWGLLPSSATDENQWKRFDAAGSSTSPRIVITYAFPPSEPTGLTINQSVRCTGKPIYTRDTTPTLYAKAQDNNPTPENVGLWFAMQDTSGGNNRHNTTGVAAASNALVGWTTNSSNSNSTAAVPNGSYGMRAYATSTSPDSADPIGATTPWWYFSVDATAPPVPTLASFDYPANAWGAAQAAPGQFTLTSAGTAAFAYSFDSSGGETAPADTDCGYNQPAKNWIAASASGTATITAPSSLAPGYHTLYAKAFDDAHNVSTQSSAYVFYVSPTIAGEGSTQLEGESFNSTLSQPSGQTDYAYLESPNGLWSGSAEEHLIATGGSTGSPQQFSFPITAGVTADYALGVNVSQQYHFGILGFELDGVPVRVNGTPVTFDAYATSTATHYVQLGGAHLTAGSNHTLTVDVIGKNAASTDYVYTGTFGGQTLNGVHDNGYAAGIDFFTVVPINNVTATSFANAMNNHGIAVDSSSAADIGPYIGKAALSQQTMTAAGFGPGATITVDGGTANQATFTMPTYPAGGPDNVMADGQSVPLPVPAQADYVDLLALSTCGNTASDPSVNLTVNFADGTNSNTQLPAVPDWTIGTPPPAGTPGITLAATLPYRDVGTGQDTAHPVYLYHLRLPTQWRDGTPNSNVVSYTLPNLGSSFTETCNTPTLHVLAAATS